MLQLLQARQKLNALLAQDVIDFDSIGLTLSDMPDIARETLIAKMGKHIIDAVNTLDNYLAIGHFVLLERFFPDKLSTLITSTKDISRLIATNPIPYIAEQQLVSLFEANSERLLEEEDSRHKYMVLLRLPETYQAEIIKSQADRIVEQVHSWQDYGIISLHLTLAQFKKLTQSLLKQKDFSHSQFKQDNIADLFAIIPRTYCEALFDIFKYNLSALLPYSSSFLKIIDALSKEENQGKAQLAYDKLIHSYFLLYVNTPSSDIHETYQQLPEAYRHRFFKAITSRLSSTLAQIVTNNHLVLTVLGKFLTVLTPEEASDFWQAISPRVRERLTTDKTIETFLQSIYPIPDTVTEKVTDTIVRAINQCPAFDAKRLVTVLSKLETKHIARIAETLMVIPKKGLETHFGDVIKYLSNLQLMTFCTIEENRGAAIAHYFTGEQSIPYYAAFATLDDDRKGIILDALLSHHELDLTLLLDIILSTKESDAQELALNQYLCQFINNTFHTLFSSIEDLSSYITQLEPTKHTLFIEISIERWGNLLKDATPEVLDRLLLLVPSVYKPNVIQDLSLGQMISLYDSPQRNKPAYLSYIYEALDKKVTSVIDTFSDSDKQLDKTIIETLKQLAANPKALSKAAQLATYVDKHRSDADFEQQFKKDCKKRGEIKKILQSKAGFFKPHKQVLSALKQDASHACTTEKTA